MQQGFRRTFNWVDRKPRQSALLNVGTYLLQGALLGLAMGLIASLGTSDFPKVWTYAANTFAVLLLRLAFQWLWTLPVTKWVHNMTKWFVKDRTGQEPDDAAIRQVQVTNNVGTIIGPAIVALAVATILSTENIEPEWLTDTWAIVGVSALAGGVASAMEALGLPSNIYAITKNRHAYQDNPNFVQARTNQGTNRNRR